MSRAGRGLRISCLALAFVGAGCVPNQGARSTPKEEVSPVMAIQLTSSAFAGGQEIPTKHTCDGDDVSPPLQWTGVPSGAKSLALVCDDPDAPAGTWVHWVICGISPTTIELAEDVPKAETALGSARQGLNDFRRVGYGGPCPPPGKPHRYFFRLYALDAVLDLGPRASKQDLLRGIEGHILAQGELMGTYRRR